MIVFPLRGRGGLSVVLDRLELKPYVFSIPLSINKRHDIDLRTALSNAPTMATLAFLQIILWVPSCVSSEPGRSVFWRAKSLNITWPSFSSYIDTPPSPIESSRDVLISSARAINSFTSCSGDRYTSAHVSKSHHNNHLCLTAGFYAGKLAQFAHTNLSLRNLASSDVSQTQK